MFPKGFYYECSDRQIQIYKDGVCLYNGEQKNVLQSPILKTWVYMALREDDE